MRNLSVVKTSLRTRKADIIAVALAGMTISLSASVLNVPERDFPLAYDVDVLVVGGTSGGVAAAVKAAQSGSRVFLMAQRPYLGEDICGAYRLWQEDAAESSSELVRTVFQPPERAGQRPLDFNYETDVPSQSPHKDTAKNTKLKDGYKDDVQKETVQYASDVEITISFPAVQQVDSVTLTAFQSPGLFGTRAVKMYLSDDNRRWEEACQETDKAFVKGQKAFTFPVNRETRFIKLSVEKADHVSRMLLSEIEIRSAVQSSLKSGEQYPPLPLDVKRTLDHALLDAGVQFLYGCYPTDVLLDSKGAVKGVIMADRAGRQVVRAKIVIDATPTAMLARIGGVEFRSEGGTVQFSHTVIARTPQSADGVTVTPAPVPVYHKGKEYPAFKYTVPLNVSHLDMHSYAEAQQQVLDKVWTPGRLAASEYAFAVPQISIVSLEKYDGKWTEIPAGAFQSSVLPGVYFLSGYADVSRSCADELLEPVHYMMTGERIGTLAASVAKTTAGADRLTSRSGTAADAVEGTLKETLAPLRPEEPVRKRVTIGAISYPVLGEYDVVVVGGGTSGAPAAIGAARRGAKTLVIEYQHAFGGVGTVGLIGTYWKGYRKGFTAEVDAGVKALKTADAAPVDGWNVLDKMEWYREQMRAAGVEMWLRSMAWGAVVKDGNHVRGVAVSTPFGPGIVLAKAVIDSTGNGDIAITAGANYEYFGPSRIGIQGTGFPPVFNIGDSYNNSDFTISYESDVVDNWHVRVYGKSEARTDGAYDVSGLIDSRERRRVIGDFYLTVPDLLMQRTYPDTIYKAFSDYDCHGVNYNSYIFLQPNPEPISCSVPYRCLLPKGLEGILTTGMGISVNNDALPLVRMQPDLQNQGYAAGTAAAMAVEAGVEPRQVDIRKLQRYLVEIGNLPEEVLTATDSFPVSVERIQEAVRNAPEEYGKREGYSCSLLFAQSETSLPLIREAYGKAAGTNKLFYAHIMAILGDATGLDTLIDHVNSRPWDVGHPRPTAKMSEVDRLVTSLGFPHDSRATDAVVQKIKQLGPESEYSHFRAVAMALDLLKDPAAAPALAELLGKPGMTGYAVHTVEEAQAQDQTALKHLGKKAPYAFSFETRELSQRELALARALYRCGDHNGFGKKILEDYSTDLRGILAAHARSVLAEK